MSLTSSQRRYLRGLAHDLKPVVLVGAKGVTDGVIEELRSALDIHELVKVRIPAEDRATFAEQAERLGESTKAQTVQTIGRVVVFYRRNAEQPRLALPK